MYQYLDKKIAYITLSIIAVTCLISCRLFYLQVRKTKDLFEQSQKNFLRIEKIPSPRGNIVACNGIILATNRPVLNLYWNGSGAYKLKPHHIELLKKIEIILEKPLIDNAEIIQKITYAERYYRSQLLANDISIEQLSKLKEQFSYNPNLSIQTSFKRFYPYKSYASHILGYLGSINPESNGKMGLEQLAEEALQGTQGIKIKTINSFGRNLKETELNKSSSGKTIKTTINMDLQQIAESIFPSDSSGALIVMDPHTGALLAVVSRPTFDPNMFLKPISFTEWNELQQKQPFLNRAFSACYPPGSIFKLITISAALEHNIIPADSIWNCRGYYTFANRRYWCHKHYGHGKLTTREALAQSCNILFFEIGKRVSIDLLAEYAYKFGFGKPTHILFPEKTGLVPSTWWKQTVKHERWWPGETLSGAIGQSFLLVSPLQVARMISSIFTQKLVYPRILADEPIQWDPLEINAETLRFLKRSMKKVVREGTGKSINTVKDIEVYAKTSTAQTSDLAKRNLGTQYLEHGWFVAHCTYKDNAPFTLVVLVENAGASQVATSIAKRFLTEYKKLAGNKQVLS